MLIFNHWEKGSDAGIAQNKLSLEVNFGISDLQLAYLLNVGGRFLEYVEELKPASLLIS